MASHYTLPKSMIGSRRIRAWVPGWRPRPFAPPRVQGAATGAEATICFDVDPPHCAGQDVRTQSVPVPARSRCALAKLLCLVVPALLSAGCASLLWRVDDQQQWDAVIQQPVERPETRRAAELLEQNEESYNLYVLTDTKGFDFTSAESFLKTLHKHPRGGKQDHSVGHSWVLLQSPDELLECGHTGEFGLEEQGYYSGLSSLIRKRDPDPVRYLHVTMRDGEYHSGPGSHEPSFVARFPITADEHRALHAYIEGYDYAVFSLTTRQCTDFVAGALKLIGIEVPTKITLVLPEKVHYGLKEMRLWTDPKFSRITLGSPEVVRKGLLELVERGLAHDATEWYYD